MNMLIYPRINPIALHLGPFQVHWYGLMYLLSFLIGWQLVAYRAKRLPKPWTSEQIIDFIFYVALGVIVGGRLGYMLFYDLMNFLHQPWIIIKIWEGGMSFHGGFLGVLATLWLWSRKNQKMFTEITDFIAPIVPIGLAAGRIGNFVQGELWGRITQVPWAMVYPHVDAAPRHPSEIYEFLLEGIVLFVILWVYSQKPRPRLAISGMFLLGYGIARCFCEFFRQPDAQFNYLAFGWLTMGQLLSIPIILGGIAALWWAYFGRQKIQ
jgi:phosphatidylglycerol:prolipoprotein diacylglycerol transferase